MEEIKEVVEELPLLQLSEMSLGGIPGKTLLPALGGVLILLCVIRGYRQGIIVELSPVAALLSCVLALFFCAPYVTAYIPAAWGRFPRALILILICVLIYEIVKSALRGIGSLFRRVPLVGWLTGILGAAAGVVEALCLLYLAQKVFHVAFF